MSYEEWVTKYPVKLCFGVVLNEQHQDVLRQWARVMDVSHLSFNLFFIGNEADGDITDFDLSTQHCPNVSTMTIQGLSDMSNSVLARLFGVCLKHNGLTKMNINHASIGSEKESILQHAFERFQNLSTLSFLDVNFLSNIATSILMKLPSLTSLTFNCCFFNDANEIGQTLANNTTITDFTWRAGSSYDQKIDPIRMQGVMMKNTTLQSLKLHPHTRKQFHDCNIFADIKHNSSLTSFTLAYLQDVYHQTMNLRIADMLLVNTTLTSLSISITGNQAIARYIKEAFSTNTTLKNLTLHVNFDNTVHNLSHELMLGLMCNTTIETLDLRDMLNVKYAAHDLDTLLKKNQTIQHLRACLSSDTLSRSHNNALDFSTSLRSYDIFCRFPIERSSDSFRYTSRLNVTARNKTYFEHLLDHCFTKYISPAEVVQYGDTITPLDDLFHKRWAEFQEEMDAVD